MSADEPTFRAPSREFLRGQVSTDAQRVTVDAGEPLVRTPNVTSAGVSVALYALGWKKLAAVSLVLNGLDIVGRQVSPDYRRAAARLASPVAGLGFVPAIRNLKW